MWGGGGHNGGGHVSPGRASIGETLSVLLIMRTAVRHMQMLILCCYPVDIDFKGFIHSLTISQLGLAKFTWEKFNKRQR